MIPPAYIGPKEEAGHPRGRELFAITCQVKTEPSHMILVLPAWRAVKPPKWARGNRFEPPKCLTSCPFIFHLCLTFEIFSGSGYIHQLPALRYER
jgi:hypothetical protein